MKLKILACLIGLLALVPSSCGRSEPTVEPVVEPAVDWEIFSFGTPEQVKAEIAKLPEDSELETRNLALMSL